MGERTALNLYYEYIKFSGIPEQYTSVRSDNTFLPRSFFQVYPEFTSSNITNHRFGYTLNHEFNDNWQIRNNFSVVLNRIDEKYTFALNIIDDRFLTQRASDRLNIRDNYFGQIDLVGKFNTGSISHQILMGFDFNRFVANFNTSSGNVPTLDILNQNYNIPEPEYVSNFRSIRPTQSYGFYLQDQISLLNNLKLLIGGRFDWVTQNNETNGIDAPEKNDSAFSPRIGLVYQPSESVSLYTSYSQAFNPSFGFNPDGESLEPTKGTQYEAGIKADFLDGKLSATLAAYQITKANIVTSDLDPERAALGFSTQVGEQRSRGIELDITGEILQGLKVIASYAYTNAEVTEDNSIPVGNKLRSVPENQASLWTTYEIQKGDLQGLGFGLGLFYVSTRPGDFANTFELPSYLRTDAAIYYRRDGWNAAINIRNLFDTDYISVAEGGRTSLQRGAPFTIIGSISWEF